MIIKLLKSTTMTTKITKYIILFLFAMLAVVTNAQSSGYDCLGTHCYISVYINQDPVTSDGYLKYTITVPPEGAYDVQGPAGAYLFNHLGSTVDFYVRKSQLLLASDGVDCEVPFELWVNKWFTGLGVYNTTGEGTRCYYWIKLLVNYD